MSVEAQRGRRRVKEGVTYNCAYQIQCCNACRQPRPCGFARLSTVCRRLNAFLSVLHCVFSIDWFQVAKWPRKLWRSNLTVVRWILYSHNMRAGNRSRPSKIDNGNQWTDVNKPEFRERLPSRIPRCGMLSCRCLARCLPDARPPAPLSERLRRGPLVVIELWCFDYFTNHNPLNTSLSHSAKNPRMYIVTAQDMSRQYGYAYQAGQCLCREGFLHLDLNSPA